MGLFASLRNAVRWAGFDLGRSDGAAAQAVVLVDPVTGDAYSASGGASGAASDRELVVSTYVVKTAFAGAGVGDTVTSTQIIDVSSSPTTVSTVWRNQTAGADFGSAPSAENLTLVGSQALTDAQLRAADVPVNVKGKTFYNSANNNANMSGLANASFGQLAAGASFVGLWESAFNRPAVQVLSGANRPMMYTIEQALDAAGTDIVSSTVFYRGSGEDLCENIQINGNYFRVTAKNIGATITTGFKINTTYGDMPGLPQALSNVGNLRVAARETQNFTRKLRDNFQSWPNANWPRISKAAGDIIQLDGNVSGCCYLVMSLDPLTANTESFIESDPIYNMPVELAVGLGTSQRTYGQEMAVQVISNDAGVLAPADVQILNIQQATNTLTINTSAAHNMRVGQRFGIYGVSQDSRLNYAALVVASTPTATQLTATAGPQGTIGTLTVGPFSPASAFMYLRDAVSWAGNGTSMVMENAAATNASFYVKAEGGDAMPIGGTLAGYHSVNTLTSTSTQAVAAALNYAFRPTTQFMLSLMADRVQWTDSPVDTSGQANNRATVSQVVPHPDAQYVVRINVKNRKGLTIPVAKIVSAAKTGTTTATVITDVAHNLTTGDYINCFGSRDQTNFANLTTATVVSSVVNATTFTVVWGAAVTATGYGGYVSRVQGQQVQQGAITVVAQSYSISNSIMTVVGNAAWTGLSIGDYINLYGCRDQTGADAGIDGTYRVRDVQTTSLFLEPIGTTTIPTTKSSVNIGGGVIRRTDLRLSFARLFDYERLRVESLPRPAGDSASAAPVVVQTGTVAVSSGTVNTVSAVTAANLNIPGTIADVASAALTTTTTASAITPTFGCSYEVSVPVTAVTGTTPTLDLSIEESDDSGTNWFKVYDFPRITATGMYRSPKLPLTGNRVRYVQTVGGTTPSFTRAINRQQCSDAAPYLRQIIDRSVSLTTLASATPAINAQQCRNAQLVVNVGAVTTTAPALQLQGSDDNGATWYAIGAALTAVASTTVQLTVSNIQAGLLRAVVTTAGVGVTAGYVLVKGF